MKKIILAVIVLAFLGGYALTLKTEYIAPEVVEKEVQVDALEQAIKTAQNAKMSEIEASAQAAYDETYAQEMKKVELEVLAEFNKKLDARQVELEKETGAY